MSCVFKGVVWIGMKMVLIRIARMLRGWLSLYKKEVGEQIEGLIVEFGGVIQAPGANQVEGGSLSGVCIKFGSFGFPALSRCYE